MDAIVALGFLSACAGSLTDSDRIIWFLSSGNGGTNPHVNDSFSVNFEPRYWFGFIGESASPFSISTSNSLAYVTSPRYYKNNTTLSFSTKNTSIDVDAIFSGNTVTIKMDIEEGRVDYYFTVSGILIAIP